MTFCRSVFARCNPCNRCTTSLFYATFLGAVVATVAACVVWCCYAHPAVRVNASCDFSLFPRNVCGEVAFLFHFDLWGLCDVWV